MNINRSELDNYIQKSDEQDYKPDMNIKDPRTFESGAVRDTVKHRYGLIPICVIRRIAKIFYEGEIKYGPHNWQKGIPFTVMIDHIMEHLYNYQRGDRSEDHLAKAAWSIMAMMFYQEYHPNMDDWTIKYKEFSDLDEIHKHSVDNDVPKFIGMVSSETTQKP